MAHRRIVSIAFLFLLGVVGCAGMPSKTTAPAVSELPRRDPGVARAAFHAPAPPPPDAPLAIATEGAPAPGELLGPQPVDAFIRRALEENRTVRAAKFNVISLRHRIPQVTTLDDPVVSNTIFPVPAVAPQFSLMGYMPYDALLAQQFPWFGTLRLRGQVAEEDVKVAVMELAASQLDAVAAVKRAYHDLHFGERAEALLKENRALAVDFLAVAKQRYKNATATQVDVLRAEVALSDIDRELENTRQGIAEARAELARQLHVSPEMELKTLPTTPVADVPAEVERLYQLAAASRPNLRGRLAAIARDDKAIELARKRFYPNVTLGLVYQDMEKKNAVTPQTAAGMPNVGLFVGFNLPVYRNKYRAGVCEAEARRAADIQLYEDERDQANRDVKDLFVQAKVQQNVIRLLSENNLVAAKRVFELTASEFRTGNAGTDLLGVLASWRDVLQVELQLAQLESELGKTLAGLERAVGVQLNEHPPDPTAAPTPASAPPPSSGGSPFRPGVRPEEKAVDDRQGEARSEPTPLPNPEARP